MEVQANKSFFKSLKRIGSLGGKIREFRGWCRYHLFNKDFKELHKVVMKTYPWDESYLYYLEKAKIEEMIKYHEKKQRFVGVEYVIRDMKLCVKLIDIFMGDETKLFHYTGDLKFIPIEGSDDVEVNGDELKYYCDVNVNMRNIDRFVNNEAEKRMYTRSPHELYMAKAKYLYHKIRLERDGAWWD